MASKKVANVNRKIRRIVLIAFSRMISL